MRDQSASQRFGSRNAVWMAAVLWLGLASSVWAQTGDAPAITPASVLTTATGRGGLDAENPFSVASGVGEFLDRLAASGRAFSRKEGDGLQPGEVADMMGPVGRGVLRDSPPEGERGYSSTISVMLVMTVLTLAPALLVLCTSFTRIVIVLALLRQAIGTASLPPSQVIVGLSLFLTLLVMAPTFSEINSKAIVPLTNNTITEQEAWRQARLPIREFMFAQIAHTGNWGDVYMIMNYRNIDTSDPARLTEDDVDMITLIPAFVLSELKTAFLMGFKLYLPFLVIDMVIASVLISMGMMMLPPVLISLPFKLLMFVLVDGWRLVTGNLLNSFALPAMPVIGG